MARLDESTNLNERQAAFCREYLKDWNGSHAAIRAGYSESTSRSIASRLLTQDNIKLEIKRLTDEALGTSRDILRYQILEGLKNIAFVNADEIAEVKDGAVRVKNTSELSEAAKYAVEEISETITKDGGSIKVKMHSKIKALELLGRYDGMFNDKLELLGGLNINTESKNAEERLAEYTALKKTAEERNGK